MKQGKIIQLFGEGTYAKSAVVTRQRRLNVYFEMRKDQDKTPVACYGTPGLTQQFALPGNLAARAILGTQLALYAVVAGSFYSLMANGTPVFTGTMGSSTGLCAMATNAGNSQVVVVDGSAGYLYTPGSATFTTLAASFPAGARTITYVSNFFVAEQPGSQNFWVSNANDGSTWQALSFGAAAAYPDQIVAVDNLAGNLIIFSQQHTEFWQNVGTSPQPFAPVTSAANEFGMAALRSAAHVNQTIIRLAQNREGQAQFTQITGYNEVVISDPDIDELVNSLGTISDAVAYSYGTGNHKFYQCTFPTANRSLLYDTTTGIWSEVQTGVSVSPVRHTGNLATYYAGKTLIADYLNGSVYVPDENNFTDNGVAIAREIITRHVLSDFNRIRISQLYLDMETGVGTQTGQGVNPQVMISYSKDNGRTWASERWSSLGLVGQYRARVVLRRFGSTRVGTWKIRFTDPAKFVIATGALKVKATANLKRAA